MDDFAIDLHQPRAELFVPDGVTLRAALSRTTHLAIGAHPDDLEIMAYHGIADCHLRRDRWFAGVVVSDGSGAPRSGPYAETTDEEMVRIRAEEQKQAARIGGYGFQALLAHPSAVVKDGDDPRVVEDLVQLLDHSRPEVVYAHNLADKHATHVALVLRTLEACRRLPADRRPRELWGCEVWRNLDWLCDQDKKVLDCTPGPHLAAALLGVFDSQIRGGKRYDLGTVGRWRANATFLQSHHVDRCEAATYAVDLRPLIEDDGPDPEDWILAHLDRLRDEVRESIRASRPRS